MKFLLVLLVVGIGVWLLSARARGGRRETRRDAAARPAAPQAMAECAHCGLHLPAADALVDGSRLYCCEEHRQRGPRAGAS